MFVVCVCAKFQVNPKVSHLYAVKRIFRYLKGQPKLGLWYPKDLPFDLVAYIDSDYVGASLERKSTIGGCQFLGFRLISWQCKKQTVVANSTTEAKYVAASSCCDQVLWIQNQLLDYGYNFMQTRIHIDNESTICIVKNPIFHSKTKHVEIRHHFIRDSYEKKLIQMIKIHTNKNVADLLTKAFDKGFGVDAGNSKLMMPGINLLLLQKVNVARHNLLLLVVVLVDKKKVIITESTIRRDLQLEDAEVQAQEEMGEGLANLTDPHHTPIITQPSTSKPQKKQKPRKPKRKDTKIPQSSGPTEPIADGAANEENVPTHSNDLLLSGNFKFKVKRLEKKGGSRTHKLKRLFKVGRSAQVISSEDEEVNLVDETQGRYGNDLVFDTSVLNGEEVFAGQDVVEKEVSTVDLVTTAGEVVTTASVEVSAATTITTTAITEVDLTLAQALAALKSAKPKVDKVVSQKLEQGTTKPTVTPTTATTTTTTKGILLQEPSETRTTTKTTTTPITSLKDNGKGIIVKEPLKMKPKDQVLFDEQEAIRLQAQFDEEERIAREKEQ
ncbi:hypothetical protein Tco_0298515 [Tanacetum coccineum]